MRSKDPNQVAARYVAIWNEADPERRREGVADLWSEDALHLLQPPQEAYESAQGLQLAPLFQARGHDELGGRVTSAYEQFVATGQMSFRPRDDASRIGDAVKFRWEGVSPSARSSRSGSSSSSSLLMAGSRPITSSSRAERAQPAP